MRVTHSEKPLNKQPLKERPNDENDPNLINLPDHKEGPRIAKIRKEFLAKIRNIETHHADQLLTLHQQYRAREDQQTQLHAQQLAEKDSYIRLLEGMVRSEQPSTAQSKQRIDESKYVLTEGTRHHPVPFFDEISDRIDFKIHRNRPHQPLSASRHSPRHHSPRVACFHPTDLLRCSSTSKHKLIPKGKLLARGKVEEPCYNSTIKYKHSQCSQLR